MECLAVGCLYVAAKCKEEDDQIPITPEFVIDCNASCSTNELLRMERLILEKFDWFADFVTSIDFLQLVRYRSSSRTFHIDIFSFQYFALLMDKIRKSNGENVDEKENFLGKYIDLETKLASCLQHHRLATFKPRILALALISVELEKQQMEQPEMNIDWLSSISYLQRLAKVNYSSLDSSTNSSSSSSRLG